MKTYRRLVRDKESQRHEVRKNVEGTMWEEEGERGE